MDFKNVRKFEKLFLFFPTGTVYEQTIGKV